MKNKLIVLNICVLLIVVYLGLKIFQVGVKPVCKHCNVILISLDTLGAEHLPCYGYKRDTAQNLCNFARDNIFFSNAFSNAPWTLPSHFSIFTSLYPNHHNIVEVSASKLDPNITTMAEFFKKNNYKTIYAGPVGDPSLPFDRGIERGFDSIIETQFEYNLNYWDEGISQLIANNKKKESTFLFLHTYWVHGPYLVNSVPEVSRKRIYANDSYPDIPLDKPDYYHFSKEFLEYIITKYEGRAEIDYTFEKKEAQNLVDSLRGAKSLVEAEKIYFKLIPVPAISYGNLWNFHFDEISDKKVAYLKDLYDEMIYRLDKKLSMIFDLASKAEFANDTIIIITSDHGEEFKEHGSLEHPGDHLYNTITAVPLIMYVPGIKQKKIDNLVQSIDILPTVLNLTGIKNPNNYFDGIDLTDSILGRWFPKQNDYLISEGPNDSIRNDRWKLYVNPGLGGLNTYELYDLYNDPQEKNNVFLKEPKIVKDLYSNLNKIIYRK